MNERIARRRESRSSFLLRLYEEVDGSVTRFVDGHELAASLGLERAEAGNAMAYLEEKGLIKVDDHRAGILRLTAAGIDAAESRILEDEE